MLSQRPPTGARTYAPSSRRDSQVEQIVCVRVDDLRVVNHDGPTRPLVEEVGVAMERVTRVMDPDQMRERVKALVNAVRPVVRAARPRRIRGCCTGPGSVWPECRWRRMIGGAVAGKQGPR